MTNQKNIDIVAEVEDVSCTEQGFHEPEDWSGVIAKQGQQLRERNKAFVDKLGEPHYISKSDSDDKLINGDDEYQYGFWRLEGGVIRMTRQGEDHGWDYYSRCEFPDAEITILENMIKNSLR